MEKVKLLRQRPLFWQATARPHTGERLKALMPKKLAWSQAGEAAWADKAIEIMLKKAKDTPLENDKNAPRIASEAIMQIRKEMFEVHKSFISTADDWKQFFAEHQFQLLLGY